MIGRTVFVSFIETRGEGVYTSYTYWALKVNNQY